MTVTEIFASLSSADMAALILLGLSWMLSGWVIEHPPPTRPSVTLLMIGYRRAWMAEFARREGRIFDANLISSLRQGTAYFASTSLIAVGAVLALIGNTDPLVGMAEGITGRDSHAFEWQMRLVPATLLLSHAFLKFVWSHRVFGYCSVMMGAVPDIHDPAGPEIAARAGELNIRAALNFNRGLRSMYFALGALAWIITPLALSIATVTVVWMLWQREFASHPRDILLTPMPPPAEKLPEKTGEVSKD